MAMNSPGGYPKSPKSPRQLPQLPVSVQKGNCQTGQKSPSTPRVFEFPPEYYPETPNRNFDFEDFAKIQDQQEPKSPNEYASSVHSSGSKSAIFQFCNPRKNGQKAHYLPKSPLSPGLTSRSPSSSSFGQKSPKPFDRRRNSCFSFGPRSPRSPTIVTQDGRSPMSPTIVTQDGRTPTSPKYPDVQDVQDVRSPREKRKDLEQYPQEGGKFYTAGKSPGLRQDRDSPKKTTMGGHFNRSQGCLNETARNDEGDSKKTEKAMARRSTSDLTDRGDADTEVTVLSSPRRRGSMKGGLAYLASRRGSRDSQASNLSNISNEGVGPLNFSAHPRGRQRRTSNFLELPVPDHIRPRVHSLPEKAYNPRAGDDLYRLRAFSITHKGVVNRGDSIISRRSRSNTSVNSSRNSNVSGERSPFDGSCCSGQGGAVESTESDAEEIPKYRVVLLGDSGVGKTALVSQFMTSEYMNTYDASLDDEFGEKTVSILLDGEESDMIFIDHPHVEMSVENCMSTYEPHACIVVYSIVSRGSFQVAEETLNYLWREHYTQERSVIVVGNKADLHRSRTISTGEGTQLATSRECKFIETSSGIQHNVDELLVGVLKQIRLRETRDKKLRRQGSKGKMLSKLHNSKTALSLNRAKEIFSKICLNDNKSKSCENLHVL
ncbi:uncharacterized protein LOC105694415 [Orussus abietinus]|uniref:uncharacterized protein LOC105694415 n=1 Tax=Orussus abietinus TaxID=222816 RepID=UPI0006265957|nr:uncharacterized protein LOC105694415 [Orussus abietinus]XP_012270481.1 uncharacterized protein LOC105694415 [Orussus abietinus]